MKKVVLLFILFVFSLSRADAQEFHFIPRIGLNLANTYPESFADMRPGLNIGVAEEIRFSKLFALEPGVYYSMQGYQKENAKGETARLKADYLNIPIYAKFYLYRGFHLFAGPQVGFNVRAKASNYIFVSVLLRCTRASTISPVIKKKRSGIVISPFQWGLAIPLTWD